MGKSKRREPRTRSRERDTRQAGPTGACNRSERLERLICEEVNFLLRSEVSDPRLQGVAVTFVELAADGSCARLWVTAEADTNEIEALERAAGFLRHHLAGSLGLKRTPELRFRRDPATRAFAPSPEETI